MAGREYQLTCQTSISLEPGVEVEVTIAAVSCRAYRPSLGLADWSSKRCVPSDLAGIGEGRDCVLCIACTSWLLSVASHQVSADAGVIAVGFSRS